MKKILFSMAAAALLLNVTSCQNEDIVLQQQEETTGQEFTLQATYGASTRTTLEGNGTGYDTKWSAGDQIFVTDGNGFVSGVLTLETGDGQKTGTFKGYVSGNPGALRYAIFPVPADGAIDLSKVDASQVDAPMTAEINAGSASFSNECGLIELTIFNIPEGEDITISEATMPAPINISGSLLVDAEDCSLTPGTPANEITVSNAKSGVPFYVPVIAGSEKSTIILKVSVDGKESKKFNVPIQKGAVSEEKTPDLYVTDDALVKWEEYAPSEDTENPGSYTIKTTPDLLWVAEQVNEEGNTFEGETLTMAADIDLNGVEWTPIAKDGKLFKGTFDGQNHTISNLKVAATDKSPVGLFASNRGLITNVKMQNVDIKGYYKAGAIVGDGLCSRVESCSVDGGSITIEPLNKDDGNHAGGIVGYLSAEPTAYVKDCSVNNLTIKAYRDLGGIAGTATGGTGFTPEVSGNTVSNTTLIIDQTADYNDVKAPNVAEIVGRLLNGTELGAGNSSSEITITFLANNTNLQSTLDKIGVGTYTVALIENIEGDATVTQKPNVKITIEGNNYDYKGVILVDGKSARYETAGLTIQNVNFNAESISADAYIRLGNGTNATRYTNNVTVKDCSFSFNDSKDVVAIKSYTGGDKNLNVSGCTVNTGMHSLLNVSNVEEGLKVEDCWVYSKNGINLNYTPAFEMNNCTFDVKGYAVRVGVNGSVNTEIKNFSIANSTLKSACEESDDAVIIFRDNATKSKLTLTNTVLSGTREFLGNTTDTQIVK